MGRSKSNMLGVLTELELRWPGGIGYWNLANVRSFLNFRLKRGIPNDAARKRTINVIAYAWSVDDKKGDDHG